MNTLLMWLLKLQTLLLGATLDYILKDGGYQQIDNKTLKKLKAIQEPDNETKNHIFAIIDGFIKAAKLKNIAALYNKHSIF